MITLELLFTLKCEKSNNYHLVVAIYPSLLLYSQLAGILSISSRFFPTVMNLLRRLAEEAQGRTTPQEQRPTQQPPLVHHQSVRNQTQQPNTGSNSIPVSSVSSNISSTESVNDYTEYSSPQPIRTRVTNIE